MVTRSVRAAKTDLVPCGTCGTLSDDEYDRFRREAWTRDHVPPTICEMDLTDAEVPIFKRMREQNPNASKLTVLTWIEGQRYDPAKDPEFLAEARAKFKEWRAR
jgi:hypothetical protein